MKKILTTILAGVTLAGCGGGGGSMSAGSPGPLASMDDGVELPTLEEMAEESREADLSNPSEAMQENSRPLSLEEAIEKYDAPSLEDISRFLDEADFGPESALHRYGGFTKSRSLNPNGREQSGLVRINESVGVWGYWQQKGSGPGGEIQDWFVAYAITAPPVKPPKGAEYEGRWGGYQTRISGDGVSFERKTGDIVLRVDLNTGSEVEAFIYDHGSSLRFRDCGYAGSASAYLSANIQENGFYTGEHLEGWFTEDGTVGLFNDAARSIKGAFGADIKE